MEDDERIAVAMALSVQAASNPEPDPNVEEGVPPLASIGSLSRVKGFDRTTATVLDRTEKEKIFKVRQYCDVCGETDEKVAWKALERHGFVVRTALNDYFARHTGT
jgi:hypothetical protein